VFLPESKAVLLRRGMLCAESAESRSAGISEFDGESQGQSNDVRPRTGAAALPKFVAEKSRRPLKSSKLLFL
jgi:hypothetical protein